MPPYMLAGPALEMVVPVAEGDIVDITLSGSSARRTVSPVEMKCRRVAILAIRARSVGAFSQNSQYSRVGIAKIQGLECL